MVSAFEKTLTKQRPGYSGTKEGPGRQVEPRRRKQSIVAFLQKLKAEPEPAPMPLPTAELAYGFPKRKRR